MGFCEFKFDLLLPILKSTSGFRVTEGLLTRAAQRICTCGLGGRCRLVRRSKCYNLCRRPHLFLLDTSFALSTG